MFDETLYCLTRPEYFPQVGSIPDEFCECFISHITLFQKNLLLGLFASAQWRFTALDGLIPQKDSKLFINWFCGAGGSVVMDAESRSVSLNFVIWLELSHLAA